MFCIHCIIHGHTMETINDKLFVCKKCGKKICNHEWREIEGHYCFGTFFGIYKCEVCGDIKKVKQ